MTAAALFAVALAGGAERWAVGELVAADFVHRTGQFRAGAAGALHDFALTPSADVRYCAAEADLRDLPLGTAFTFTLRPGPDGRVTHASRVEDQFTLDARAGRGYRAEAVAGGALRVTDRTRFWKGGKPARRADVAAPDELLVNLAGPGRGTVRGRVGRPGRAAARHRTAGRAARGVRQGPRRAGARRADRGQGDDRRPVRGHRGVGEGLRGRAGRPRRSSPTANSAPGTRRSMRSGRGWSSPAAGGSC